MTALQPVGTGHPGSGRGPADLIAPAPENRTVPARTGADPSALWSTLFLAMSVAALWFLLFTLVLSGLQEHGTQARLYARFRSQLANETAPVAAPIRTGDPVALISAPEAGLDRVVVVEGSSARQLLAGPGHMANTALPGQIGTSVIQGRALAYGGPFGAITALRPGDPITVTTGQGTFTYWVQGIRRAGDRGPAPITGTQSRLTLVTAAGGWLGRLTPSRAVYVDALLAKGPAQPVPAPLPSVGADSLPMHGNAHALVPLIFWLEALAVVEAAVLLAWRRWGRWQSWMAGVPLLAGAAWGVSESFIQFLPNLF